MVDRIRLSNRMAGILSACSLDRNSSALYREIVESGAVDQIRRDIIVEDVLAVFEFHGENSHIRNYSSRPSPHEEILSHILTLLPSEFSREIQNRYEMKGYLEREDIKVCYKRLVGRSE